MPIKPKCSCFTCSKLNSEFVVFEPECVLKLTGSSIFFSLLHFHKCSKNLMKTFVICSKAFGLGHV